MFASSMRLIVQIRVYAGRKVRFPISDPGFLERELHHVAQQLHNNLETPNNCEILSIHGFGFSVRDLVVGF